MKQITEFLTRWDVFKELWNASYYNYYYIWRNCDVDKIDDKTKQNKINKQSLFTRLLERKKRVDSKNLIKKIKVC